MKCESCQAEWISLPPTQEQDHPDNGCILAPLVLPGPSTVEASNSAIRQAREEADKNHECAIHDQNDQIVNLQDTILAMLCVAFNRPIVTVKASSDDEIKVIEAITKELGGKPSDAIREIIRQAREERKPEECQSHHERNPNGCEILRAFPIACPCAAWEKGGPR